jgi:multicomponent Na+:H+ antiporter subunit D
LTALHFPALQVVVPLLAATLCAMIRNGTAAWAFATAVVWAMFGVSVTLLHQVLTGGPISYAMGDWEPPWGIEYRIDALNAFVLVIVSFIGAVVMPYARRSVAAEVRDDRLGLFYAMFLLCFTGLLGITITGDVFNVFVFLEISSLATYVLIAMGRNRRALTAAYQYLILGTIGATFFVIGIGLAYLLTGTLNMRDMAERLARVEDARAVAVAFAFLTVGICLKLALFPLHLWLPNAYTFAPSAVTAFLAATATKVSIYLLIRFFYGVFGAKFSFGVMPLSENLLILAIAGIVVGGAVAIFQDDLKRVLAYSSVGQIGYIVLGIALNNETGLLASLLHLAGHALTKGSLFLLSGCFALQGGALTLASLSGVAKRMPFVSGAVALAALSLIGAPLTVGLLAKWYLVQGALERGWWLIAAIVLLTSLLTVVYAWRVIEVMYFRETDPRTAPPRGRVPADMAIPAFALVALCFYLGTDSGLFMTAARAAARAAVEGLR